MGVGYLRRLRPLLHFADIKERMEDSLAKYGLIGIRFKGSVKFWHKKCYL